MPSFAAKRPASLLRHLLLGIFFGVLLIKSEVVSWYRIQEMFRLQSVHMYGVIGSAVLVAALTLALLRHFRVIDATDDTPRVKSKKWQPGRRLRYVFGGVLFGLGWGLTGTCPGPIYALIGYGADGALVVLLSALLGARLYAAVADRLPH